MAPQPEEFYFKTLLNIRDTYDTDTINPRTIGLVFHDSLEASKFIKFTIKDYYKKQNKFYGISGVGTIEEIKARSLEETNLEPPVSPTFQS